MDNYNNYNFKPQSFKPPSDKRRFLLLVSGIGLVLAVMYFFIFGTRGIIIRNNGIFGSIGGQGELPIKDEVPDQALSNPLPNPESDRFDVLILGIRGEDDIADGGLLTDTMLVLSLDKKTGAASLISIPRDLYINMLGVKGKINRVYETGLAQNKGLDLTSNIISRISGIYIDKAIVFDLDAFGTIIDQLDGIDITLAAPFTETTQWGYPFSLPAGKNHLNKEQALYYVRSRYSSSDFDRARRQQQVIEAIKTKILSLDLLSNPTTITGLIAAMNGHIKTNFQLWDIKDLITLAKNLSNIAKVKQYVLTTDNVLYDTKTKNGEYILLTKSGNFDDIKTVFQTSITGKVPIFTSLPSNSPTPTTKK